MRNTFAVMAPEQLARYNAQDAMLTARIWARQQGALAAERRVYEADKALAWLCAGMTRVGILIDTKVKQDLSFELGRRAAEQLAVAKAIAGPDFNPSTPKHLRKALFGVLGAPILKPTATGLAATDKAVLTALAATDTEAGRLARAVQEWRYAAKLRATFVEGIHPEADGRVHASWRSFGTVSGRLACRNPNLQNIPRARHSLDPRAMYVAKPGCQFVYFDVGQAEMRFSAYLSGDEKAIAEVAPGKDCYVEAALRLFAEVPGAVEALTQDPKGKGKALRQLAKMARLAANYLIVAESLYPKLKAEGMNVDFKGVQRVLDKIHETYRQYFHFVEENTERCRRVGYIEDPILGRKRRLGFEPSASEIANYPIQAGIASVMNQRLLRIHNTLEEFFPEGVRPKIVAQVHDSCLIETREGQCPTVGSVVADVWAEPVVLKNGASFILPIDLRIGNSMASF